MPNNLYEAWMGKKVSIRVRGGGGAEREVWTGDYDESSQSASEAEAVPNKSLGSSLIQSGLNPRPRRRRC